MNYLKRNTLLWLICLGLSMVIALGSGCSDDAAQSNNDGQPTDTEQDGSSPEKDTTSSEPDGGQAQDASDAADTREGQDATADADTSEEPDTNQDPDTSDEPDASEPRACGGWVGDTCEADEYCKFPEGTMCDYADGSGHCEPRPTDCPSDEPAVCGCDGTTYRSACDARREGTDVATEGACEGDPTPALCDAQDARGVGNCDAVFGPFWDGNSCQYASGCSCEGSDCDKSYENIEACETAHESCIDDCRTQGCDNPGETCQLCWTSFLCLDEFTAC